MRTFNQWMTAAMITTALAVAGPAAAQSSAGAGGAGQSGTAMGAGGQAGTSGAGQAGGSGDMGGGQAGNGSIEVNGSRNDLQKFVEKAAMGNMAEIQLGQLAQQKAQDPEVKQFAQMMVDQHTKAQSELQQAASAAGLSLPSTLDSKHQKIQDRLSSLSGSDFDKQYMKVMVDAHKDTQKLLEKRAGKSTDYASGHYGAGGTMGTSGSGAGTATGTSGAGAGTSGTTGGTATGTSGTAGTTAATGTTGENQGASGSAAGTGMNAPMSIDSWAQATLPEVQQHLQQARDLEKRVKDQAKNDKSGRSDK